MLTDSQLKARVRGRLAELERSPIEAADIGGLERNYIRDWFAGKKASIKRQNYPKIAKGLEWTEAQLLAQGPVKSQIASIEASEAATVPEIDLRAGASYGGGFGQEEVVSEGGELVTRDAVRANWGIPVPFLREELRMRPGRAHILAIRGDSMMDTLFDGDRAVVDLDDTDVSQGGIFAILDDNGSVIVKQVELVRGQGAGRIRCTSRNANYHPFELSLEDPVRIIGRVACKITRL